MNNIYKSLNTNGLIFRGPHAFRTAWFALFVVTAALALHFWDSSSVPAHAAAPASVVITATPITWNVVGLDSNSPSTGPNRFPVGTRVCNTGTGASGTVTAVFVWDSANSYINLRSGSLSSVLLGAIAAGSCADAYFEAEVDKNSGSAPYNTTRKYHVTATDALSGSSTSTATGRELFVEKLISQNRNGVDSIKLNGTAVPAGGGMTLVVGNTYTIELAAHTATQGYNQLEGFINFPNTIFQTLGVSSTYSANTSPYVASPNDKLYANACLWDEDLNSPNYRSCIGGDGKTGGTVVTTYTVKIISGGGTSQSLGSLLYDFSGSSYHYNADYGVGARIANIVSPASVSMSKTFTPRAIAPGGTSAMTFKLSNPTSENFSGVNFTDVFPSGLQVAATPGVTYSGCGAGTFTPTPLAGAASLAFANGTLAANSTCTITVNVTAPAGTYANTTGHLFLNTSVDTGNFGQDTLTVAAVALCTPGQTLATWTMPTAGQGSGGPPPPYTTKAANVATAVATAGSGLTTTIASGGNVTNDWEGHGFPKTGTITGDSVENLQFAVDTSKYSGVTVSFDYTRDNNWGGGGTDPVTMYVYSSTTGVAGSFNPVATITNLTNAWQSSTPLVLPATSSATTYIRIIAKGTNAATSSLYIDNISIKGCGLPLPSPTISKSFAPKTIVKGASSTLSFTVNNTAPGNQALTGIAFSDVLTAGLSIPTSSAAACAGTLSTNSGTRTIALTGGQLAAGASCTFNVTVTGTTEGNYDNITGYVSSTEAGTSTNYATDSLTVVAPPAIGKAFSPSAILTAGMSTLSFTITNPNQLTALSGVGFTDALPSGVTVASSGPTSRCGGSLSTVSPSSITLTGALLAANTSCTFSVTVTGTTAGSKVNTTGTVTSTEGGAGNAATATLVVNAPTPVIDLNKQISKDGVNWFKFVGVPVGGNVYYRFTAYNGGDVTFTGISVTDATLAGTSADPATCAWTLPLISGDTGYCVNGPIAAASGSHLNTATATGTYSSGTATSSPSTATYATTGLTIAKNSTETYFTAVGNVLHYSYVVTNSGFAPLLGPVTVADDKSSDESCPAVSTVGDLDGYLDPAESITCNATYTVTATDMTNRYVTNLASATVSGTTSNTATKTLNLATDLSISKSSSPKPYSAGSALTYTIVVTNNGPGAVVQAQVTDTLPPALASFSWTCAAAGAGAACGVAGPVSGNINSLVDLPVATQAIFTVTGTVPAGTTGSLNNTAVVTPPSGIIDLVPGNNTATDTNGLGPRADLAITKSSSPKPYIAGSSLTYTIKVTNNGPSSVTGATVSDAVPAVLTGVTWTSSTAGAAAVTSGSSGSGNSLAATLNVGASSVDSVTFTVTGTVPVGTTGPISNTASVAPPAGTSDPVPGNNSASDINPTGSQADLAITKTASLNPYVAGSPLTYTIVVSNIGAANVVGARVQDALPPAVSGFTWTCTSNGAGTCIRASGSGDIDALVNLPSGTQVTFLVSGTVPAGTTGPIVNTATVAPPNGVTDPVPSNNSAATGNAVTAAGVALGGRILTRDGLGLVNAVVTLTDQQGVSRTAISSSFGYYQFEDVESGGTYIISVTSKRYTFLPQVISVIDDLTSTDLTAEP